MSGRLQLISKRGCHLCEEALELIESVLAEVKLQHPQAALDLELVDLFASPEITARYAEEIPVLLIDGKVHGYWRFDRARLLAALTEAAAD